MNRPTIVCLCGSTRFGKAFADANLRETLAGRIVLTIGCNMRDDDLFAMLDPEEVRRIKIDLDALHKRKAAGGVAPMAHRRTRNYPHLRRQATARAEKETQ